MEKMQKKMSGLEPRDVLIRLCVGVFSKSLHHLQAHSEAHSWGWAKSHVEARSLKIAGRIQAVHVQVTYRAVTLDYKI